MGRKVGKLSEAAAMALARTAMTHTTHTATTATTSGPEPIEQTSTSSSESAPGKVAPPPPPRHVQLMRMIELPSIEQLVNQLERHRQMRLKANPVDHDAHRLLKHQQARIEAEIELAKERDQILATRPDGCWCLGQGGRDPGWIWFKDPEREPIRSFVAYCDCPEGVAAKASALQAERARDDEGLGARQETLLKQLGYVPRIPLAAFNPVEIQSDAYAQMVAWAEGADCSILLYGMASRGKTTLAKAALYERVSRELRPGMFWGTTQLLKEITRRELGSRGDGFIDDELEQRVQRIPLLVLDDLGKERDTDYRAERIYELLNERDEYKRPTVITTNLTLKGLSAKIGQPTFERIVEMCGGVGGWVTELKGPSHRLHPSKAE
jgi:DNA replication protein DnaC